jgi:hypothetical protein
MALKLRKVDYALGLVLIGWFVCGFTYGLANFLERLHLNYMQVQALELTASVSLRNEFGHLPSVQIRSQSYLQWKSRLSDSEFDAKDDYLDGP